MPRFAAITIALAFVLAACAQEIRVPVTGQTSTGLPAAGEAVANFNGEGTFWVQFPGAMRCEGTYDALSRASSFVVPVRCSDGRTGEAVVTRQLNMLSGTAIVQLNDGTRGQFVFGDLTFEQAFGSGTTRTR